MAIELCDMARVHTTSHILYTQRRTSGAGGQSAASEKQGEAPLPQVQQLLVLIAEDEETIAETLAMIVADAGYVALVAHDGREALALARQHRPHLIVTDLMMPYLSGADLIATVREEALAQGQSPPPVLVVTAASRARAEEAGADAVIIKPFDVLKIEAEIAQLLSRPSGESN